MGRRLGAGQAVRLRPPAEILATLDDEGRLDGLPFMPEMLRYFGAVHRVNVRAERACDTLHGPGTQRLPDTVVLDDLRCQGTGHGGCQAQCRLYWKEAWLAAVTDGEAGPAVPGGESYTKLRRLAQRNAIRGKVGNEPLYRCQMTELLRASVRVAPREAPVAFVRELTSGNVGPRRFFRVLARTVFEGVAATVRLRKGLFMPDPASEVEAHGVSNGAVIDVGDTVRVRSREEIAQTLDAEGKTRGLWFDREMLPYCGGTYRVAAKVTRFIDEASGRLVRLQSDCFRLDGVVCTGDRSNGRRFCCRAIYPWWRTAWLSPVEANDRLTEAGRTPSAG